MFKICLYNKPAFSYYCTFPNRENDMLVKSVPVFVLLLLFVFSSCENKPVSKLESALALSGDNRSELERVLTRYAADPADSLKLRAAVFLIENMPGHYTYKDGCMPEYIAAMDSLYPNMPYTVKKVVYSLPFKEGNKVAAMKRVYDIDVVTADFLVDHVDNMIACREGLPWLKSITFDDFCEYVLPYRTFQEPLIGWADSTRYIWKELGEGLLYYDDLPHTLENAMLFQRGMAGGRDDIYLKGLIMPSGTYDFDCIERSYYDINCFRSAGIASAVDFIPHWPTRNGQHYWRVVIDPDLVHSNMSDVKNPKAAKVYRKSFSHNEIPRPSDEEEFVPELFRDPFNRDVSAQYMNVKDISLSLNIRRGDDPEYVYLAVFNNLAWHPVAWAKIDHGKAVFRDFGLNIVALPVYFKEKDMIQAGPPVIIQRNGETTALLPDQEHRIDMTFFRKYPLTFSKTQWTRNLLDACFEGSNHPSFAPSDTLHVIDLPSKTLNFVTVPIDPAKAYRYWRISKSGRYINLGELVFLDPEGNSIQGEIIYSTTLDEKIHHAFDGDVLTYNHTYDWLGMDFKKPVSLSAIKYISRTDANGIVPGDFYELLYYDDNKWMPVESKTAYADSISFSGVPSGALYWLRNLTEGREERIFTYGPEGKVFQ